MADKIIKLSGTIKRTVYDSDRFAVYALDVPSDIIEAKRLKRSKYGDVTICGNISGLETSILYDFDVIEQQTKHGYSYEVKKCVGSKDYDSGQNIVLFLTSILTDNQAFELLKHYPNIVELIVHGKSDQVDLNKLHGIKEATFDVIKRKILENHDNMELLSFFGGAVSLKTIAKIREQYPSIDSIKKLFKKDPYEFLIGLQGISFIKADRILIDMQKEQNIFDYDLVTSQQRCLSYIKFRLNSIAEEEGSTVYGLTQLKEDVDSQVPKCANHFSACLKSNAIWYDVPTMSVALAYLRDMESKCADIILDALKSPQKWDVDILKYKNTSEGDLSEEQLSALQRVCDNNISVLNGVAGSGKTYTCSVIIKMLDDMGKDYCLMSPTAKASRVMSSYSGRPASTIHRGYGYTPSTGWQINEKNKLNTDILIIDEVSMLSISILLHVLQGLDFERTKLLLIGDSAQLSSIGAGSVLHDIINSGVVPATSLTKVFRYKDGGISKMATDIRNCKTFLPPETSKHKTLLFGVDRDYSFTTSTDDEIVDDIVKIYSRLIESGKSSDDILVITAYNVGKTGTQAINNAIQKKINKNYGTGKSIKFNEIIFYEGDYVIQKRNNYHATECDPNTMKSTGVESLVCNGDVGRIIGIYGTDAIIQFDDKYYHYTRPEFVDVKLGYAISVHSSQGSQSDTVIFACPRNQTFMMSSNLLYVGCTRSKKRCIHIGDPYMVTKAVKRKDEKHRNTFLCSFLSKRLNTHIDKAV